MRRLSPTTYRCLCACQCAISAVSGNAITLAEEFAMAKGQKRSSRETKKPKAKKAAAPLATANFAKANVLDIGRPKKP